MHPSWKRIGSQAQFASIGTIPFCCCLVLLLLNDFYLKQSYGNWFTGKLSDVCGLYVFVVFWSAFFPHRKGFVYVATAILFIIWKSPASQPFIDWFSTSFYSIHRVVDPSDLIALLILPVSFAQRTQKLGVKIHPIVPGVLTIFAFCATSIPRPSQQFEIPEYVLFKSGVVEFQNRGEANELIFYPSDSFVVIGVNEIGLEMRPYLQDEFQKAQVLKDLDLLVLRECTTSAVEHDLLSLTKLKASLTVGITTHVDLKIDSVIDQLNFKGTRLHGLFVRLSDQKQVLISGSYKDGIEDSTWTFYDQNNVASRKYFEAGELVKSEVFDEGRLVSTKKVLTREQKVTYKYVHLIILFILMCLVTWKLWSVYRSAVHVEKVFRSHFVRIGLSIILPLIILTVAKILSLLIPNAYHDAFFEIMGEVFLVCIVGVPLMLVIFYASILRRKTDLLFYIALLVLIILFAEECVNLNRMTP